MDSPSSGGKPVGGIMAGTMLPRSGFSLAAGGNLDPVKSSVSASLSRSWKSAFDGRFFLPNHAVTLQSTASSYKAVSSTNASIGDIVLFGLRCVLGGPFLFFNLHILDPIRSGWTAGKLLMDAGVGIPLSPGPWTGRVGVTVWCSDEVLADRDVFSDPMKLFQWIGIHVVPASDDRY